MHAFRISTREALAYDGNVAGDANAIRQMFEDVSLGAPENAVGFVLWRIVARYQREMDRALANLGLTHFQFVTLALVAWFGSVPGPITQIELAQAAGIHPMQLSQTLKALETKRMVSRRRSQADTRAKRVEITAKGLSSLRQALPLAIAVQDRLFGEAGRPGGAFLEELLQLYKSLPQESLYVG